MGGGMSKTKCFISFDYDNDAKLKELLIGQSKQKDSPFEISDWSIKEASSNWRSEARGRIKQSDVVIVICGKNTHTATGVAKELKIVQEERIDYFLLAGYSDGGNTKPTSAKVSDSIYKWTWDNLKRLINGKR
jgi:hypothetical protein